ncbi:signal peptidase I [Pyrococcus yayanosii]|uniref:Signal peptidase I n=1 Tax=Pyrococcus yayanosii (strain CH1 / JCM 16557) TaxID=529709 RepID=F8AF78_PYRYC|nr:signal peptidase I [Pyrococcus yayanosii]AEH24906.1 signal peptidase I, putative [Pyrococcus yayanosii CH1]
MRIVEVAITLAVFIFVTASATGFILGRPLFVSYVYSDSMKPTLEQWDLFFINPLSKGDVGDIIVFKLDGKWVVHRIYAISGEGYITKGDNNVATDQQDGKAEPIKRGDVAGKVITIGGKPLKIPRAGKHLNSPYVAVGLVLFGTILLTTGGKKSRKSRKSRRRFLTISFNTLYGLISTILLLMFVFSTMLSWGTIGIGYASTAAGGQREGWYLPGSTFTENITVENRGLYPLLFILEGNGIGEDSAFMLFKGESKDVPVTVKVPEETRVYRENVHVYAFIPILPASTIEKLYGVSPYLPIAVQIAELSVLLTLLRLAIGEGEPIRIKSPRTLWS